MPIGKNSIKRVANNGYSNVKTNAPDMENSTVIANPSPEVVEKMLPKATAQKPAAKKTAATSKPKTETTAKKPSANSTKKTKAKSSAVKKEAIDPAKKTVEKQVSEEKSFVNIGREMPIHLL